MRWDVLFKVESYVRAVESDKAINEIEVEHLRELALEQQEIIEILKQTIKVMDFSWESRHIYKQIENLKNIVFDLYEIRFWKKRVTLYWHNEYQNHSMFF